MNIFIIMFYFIITIAVLLIFIAIYDLIKINHFSLPQINEDTQKYETSCPKCKAKFSWDKTDIIVNTNKYLISCPHCNKLMYFYKE